MNHRGSDWTTPGVVAGRTCSVYLSISISDEYGTVGFLPHNADPRYVRGTAHLG